MADSQNKTIPERDTLAAWQRAHDERQAKRDKEPLGLWNQNERHDAALALCQRIFNEVNNIYHSRSGEPHCLFCEASLGYEVDKHKDDCIYMAILRLIAGEQ